MLNEIKDWKVSITRGVAEIVLSRPDNLNAQRTQTFKEIHKIMDSLEADSNIRAVILRGEGRAFSAGADLKEYAEISSDAEAFAAFQRTGLAAYQRLSDSPLPVIVAIHGYALGGGLELALHGDILIAAEDAKLGFPEIKVGLIAGGSGIATLLDSYGLYKSAYMLLTGDPISANEAFSMGLLSQVVPSDQLLQRVRQIAEKIASNPPLAVRAHKRLFVESARRKEPLTSLEYSLLKEVFNSEDAKEGIQAFKEKRPPVFRGK